MTMNSFRTFVLSTCLSTSVLAFPAPASDDATDNTYRPPGPNDSRAPCPGLNTLANHGFIPRDGRQVSAADMTSGFLNGFGMDQSTVSVALKNAFTVCEYIIGSDCNGVLPNLTILAEPHTFEHDHSMSRQDYRAAWANGDETDNYNFNSTVFQTVLDTVGDNTHIDFQLFNEIRLVRMSDSLVGDVVGWFQKQIPVMTVEIGFVFSVMADFNLPDAETNPQVRTDWWHYWFANESFPEPLGWHKPNPPRNSTFVLSCSSAVLAATSVASTPSPVMSDWITVTDKGGLLPTTATVPILALPTYAPYVAEDAAALEVNGVQKRDATATATATTQGAAAAHAQAAFAKATDQVVLPNPYVDVISLEEFKQIQAIAGGK